MYTSHRSKPSRSVGPWIKAQRGTNMRQKKIATHYFIKTSSSGEHCTLHILYSTESMLKSTGTKGKLQIQHVHEDVYNYHGN
jgi:hypothetical protein